MSTFAVVPVKTLQKSKTRLSNVLTFQERSLFTLAMLGDVLSAFKDSNISKVVVVSADMVVEGFTKDFGVSFLKENQEGLNGALNQATKWCAQNGAELVLVVPADIPLVTGRDINQLVKLAMDKSMVISPSHNGGTNGLLRKPPNIISPCFGLDSFKKHLNKASTKHVSTKVYVSSNFMLDIDCEDDLARLLKVGKQTAAYRFLKENNH